MRHKYSIERIIEQIESLVVRSNYYMKAQDTEQARSMLNQITELIENTRTLLNSEEQD